MRPSFVSGAVCEIGRFRGIDCGGGDGAFAACDNVRFVGADELASLLAASKVNIMQGCILPVAGVYTTYTDCDSDYETYMSKNDMFARIAPKRVLSVRGNTAVMRIMIGETLKYGKNQNGYRHILGAYQYDGQLYILYDAVYRIVDQRFDHTLSNEGGSLVNTYVSESSAVCNLYQLWLDEIRPNGQITSLLLDAAEEQKHNIPSNIARDMTVGTPNGFRHITDDFIPEISGVPLYFDRTYTDYYAGLHNVSLPDASFTARTVVSCRDRRHTYRLILPDMRFLSVTADGCALTSLGEGLPAFSYAVQHFGRLFGITGDKLYASRVGDFTDFTPPQDPLTDPEGPYFTAAVGDDGDYTALCSFGGKLLAFTARSVLTTAGQALPFTLSRVAAVGCAGASAVCVQAHGVYFISGTEVLCYNGRNLTAVSDRLGLTDYSGATLACAGDLIVLCAGGRLYFYDTKSKLWSARTASAGTCLCGGEGGAALLAAAGGTEIYRLFAAGGDFSFSLRTGAFRCRQITAVSVRAAIAPDASLSLTDKSGVAVCTFTGDGGMQTYTARLRKHYATSDILRFCGRGDVRVYKIALHTRTRAN